MPRGQGRRGHSSTGGGGATRKVQCSPLLLCAAVRPETLDDLPTAAAFLIPLLEGGHSPCPLKKAGYTMSL